MNPAFQPGTDKGWPSGNPLRSSFKRERRGPTPRLFRFRAHARQALFLQRVSKHSETKRPEVRGHADRDHLIQLERNDGSTDQTADERRGKGASGGRGYILQDLCTDDADQPDDDCGGDGIHEDLRITTNWNIAQHLRRAEPTDG